MKCRKAQKNIIAYLDGELKYKQEIEEHLNVCPECKKELDFFSKQDELVSRLEEINPSSDFRVNFWRNVEAAKQGAIKKAGKNKMFRWSWMPIPVMSFLIAIMFLNITVFSSRLFAKSPAVKNQVVLQVVKNILTPSHIVNPVAFIKLCRASCETLCKCIQGKCPMCMKSIKFEQKTQGGM